MTKPWAGVCTAFSAALTGLLLVAICAQANSQELKPKSGTKTPNSKAAQKAKPDATAEPVEKAPPDAGAIEIGKPGKPEKLPKVVDETSPTSDQETKSKKSPSERWKSLIVGLTVFVLAIFVGFEVIAKVPPTLHTPLMSGSNAISGITIVGSIIIAGQGWSFPSFVGMIAVALAAINVVGGFLVTHRMLAMFKRR